VPADERPVDRVDAHCEIPLTRLGAHPRPPRMRAQAPSAYADCSRPAATDVLVDGLRYRACLRCYDYLLTSPVWAHVTAPATTVLTAS
jgi:hypothetical protein